MIEYIPLITLLVSLVISYRNNRLGSKSDYLDVQDEDE
jgi:hypothetical protein